MRAFNKNRSFDAGVLYSGRITARAFHSRKMDKIMQ